MQKQEFAYFGYWETGADRKNTPLDINYISLEFECHLLLLLFLHCSGCHPQWRLLAKVQVTKTVEDVRRKNVTDRNKSDWLRVFYGL